MFWEKADFDDTDPFAAFRKRIKDRMKLRKKMKIEIDSYKRMLDIRRDSVQVLQILKQCYQRDSIKKNLNTLQWKEFELQLDQSSKAPNQKKNLDLERYRTVKVDELMPFHVETVRDMHQLFIPHQYSQENT
mmetsp:Transcript_37266/g.35883  ORF Transcript_37266/g.35883 Transcript_37266/m.35883 type:complete len:132 (+) Transcript_37266:765-1160(+)